MTISSYKALITNQKKGVLCFLVNEENIMLCRNKVRLGHGLWSGFGGELNDNEDFASGAQRFAEDEITIEPKNTICSALINIYGISDEFDSLKIAVFFIDKWDGLPDETDAIQLEWFSKHDLPLSQMSSNVEYWLPRLLAGEKLTAEFLYDEDKKIIDYSVNSEHHLFHDRFDTNHFI